MNRVNANPIHKTPEVVDTNVMRSMLGGITRKTAYKILKSGKIPCSRVSHTYQISFIGILRYIDPLYGLSKQERQARLLSLRQYYEGKYASYPDVVNVLQLEQMLEVSNNYVLPRLNKGIIKGFLVKRRYRIPKECVIDFAITDEYQKYISRKQKTAFPYTNIRPNETEVLK